MRIHPRVLAAYGSVFGLGMIVGAWVWTRLIHTGNRGAWFPATHWPVDIGIGSLGGAAFALIAWALFERVPALRRVGQLILNTLDMNALRVHHAVMFGLIAGIPEEILFRGALQPTLGWVITSLIFGALHGITPAYFAYATVAGGVLGWLTLWRDGLWAAVAAHVTIDTIMFLLLIQRWRRER
ncbi:MAG: CPBP family intramembrane metalloprotease [Anaerolineae bacterium]|nr:CPBP family intramembrane metalloprotease [Anaerolineae bacterium]